MSAIQSGTIRVALVGFGYWGPNIARAITRVRGFELVSIVDASLARRQNAAESYKQILTTSTLKEAITSSEPDAVIVATPASSHFRLTSEALDAGCHVLVEKPLAVALQDAELMVSSARKNSRVLMVDHTYLFSPAIDLIKTIVSGPSFGEKVFFDSTRSNLGIFQPDISVIWDLAVHDVAILLHLVDELPKSVWTTVGRHRSAEHDAAAYLTLEYESGFFAHIGVSWLTPMKIRRTLISGTNETILFDDSLPDDKIKIFQASVSREPTQLDLLQYRLGDVHIPRVVWEEPLVAELGCFRDAIINSTEPKSSGRTSLDVIRVLEAARRSADADGAKQELHWP